MVKASANKTITNEYKSRKTNKWSHTKKNSPSAADENVSEVVEAKSAKKSEKMKRNTKNEEGGFSAGEVAVDSNAFTTPL